MSINALKQSADEWLRQYAETEAQIKALQKRHYEMLSEVPRLYYVNMQGHRPPGYSGGNIPFVSENRKDCIGWVEANFPELVIKPNGTKSGLWCGLPDTLAATCTIDYETPLAQEKWEQFLKIKAKQDKQVEKD